MHGGTTTTRSEEEAKEILESLGNMTNAYTSFDHTAYYIKTTQDNIGTAVDLLADWMMNTKVTEKEFDREMQVVQREAERARANHTRTLFQMARENMFREHPVRYPILGHDYIRAKLRLQDVKRYRAKMYVPNNMVFVAVGDFKWAEMLEKVRSAFNGFHRGAAPSTALPDEPVQVHTRMAERHEPTLSADLLLLSYHTIPLTHPDLYALDVMAGVLGKGESSRLVRIIKNDRNLVQRINAWSYTPGYDAGRFSVFAVVPNGKDVQTVIADVQEQINRLKTEPVGDAELERVKNQVVADHVYSSQTIESQARSITRDYLSSGDPDFYKQYVAGIQKVTAGEVRRVANTYFSEDKLCVTKIQPEKDKGMLSAQRPEAAEASDVRKIRLKNGLTVLLKRNPNLPVVAFEMYYLAGLRAETRDTSGISNFTAQLWSKETENRTRNQLAEELDRLGAELSTGSGNNTFFLRGTCLAKDFRQMTDIVADVTLNPSFPKDECEKLRVQLLNAIKRRDDNVKSQAQHLLNRTFYPESSPYSMDTLGRPETVKQFSTTDLKGFYNKYARGTNGVLAIYGDIALDEAESVVRTKLEDLPGKPAPEIEPVAGIRLSENEKATAYRDGQKAAAVFMAFPGMEFGNVQDRYTMKVLDVILSGGGHPGGWLHNALRGEGLVYEVHAFNYLGLDPRHFQIQAVTNPAAVKRVTQIILEKVQKMKDGDITQKEFDQAKNICISEELMNNQTNSAQAQSAAIDELYGLNYDFHRKFADRVEAVTIDDVVRVANEYLDRHVTAVVTIKPQNAKADGKKTQAERPE
jgi:zinc protease